MTEFGGWASVDADKSMHFDWDDLAGIYCVTPACCFRCCAWVCGSQASEHLMLVPDPLSTATGDAKRREQGLRLEAQRLAEMKRLKKEERQAAGGRSGGPAKGAAEMAEAMRASRQKKE